jgi:hypothetical protein
MKVILSITFYAHAALKAFHIGFTVVVKANHRTKFGVLSQTTFPFTHCHDIASLQGAFRVHDDTSKHLNHDMQYDRQMTAELSVVLNYAPRHSDVWGE